MCTQTYVQDDAKEDFENKISTDAIKYHVTQVGTTLISHVLCYFICVYDDYGLKKSLTFLKNFV